MNGRAGGPAMITACRLGEQLEIHRMHERVGMPMDEARASLMVCMRKSTPRHSA
jgi:hypothetical protein